MLTLQMLPAGCGDSLWIEYGTSGATRIVLIDGGVRDTAAALRKRIESAQRERRVQRLELELLVVTHIDNDHILGILEILGSAPDTLTVKDVWFNGRRQLVKLPPPDGKERKRRSNKPKDLLGSEDNEGLAGGGLIPSPADLLGPKEGDLLSDLLEKRGLPWNQAWNGEAIVVPETGSLPVITLDGKFSLTLLGPTYDRLYKLCESWPDVISGRDNPHSGPADLLGRRDVWPPVWKDGEQRDPSPSNGSSIMFLVEYDGHALLLTGDGFAPDLEDALERLCREREVASGAFPLDAFKLPHHGSDKNLTAGLLGKTDCSRYMISTDGSTHRHPDHQALLRILRHSKRRPRFLFNYDAATTRPWGESKEDVLEDERLKQYETEFPRDGVNGLLLELK